MRFSPIWSLISDIWMTMLRYCMLISDVCYLFSFIRRLADNTEIIFIKFRYEIYPYLVINNRLLTKITYTELIFDQLYKINSAQSRDDIHMYKILIFPICIQSHFIIAQ